MVFSTAKLAQRLAEGKVRTPERLFYVISLLVLLALRIGVFNVLPTLYTTIFVPLKERLELEAKPADFKITVYDFADQLFTKIAIGIFLIGILLAWLSQRRGTNRTFIDNFICLSWPTQMRIMLTLVFLFTLVLGVTGGIFFTELQNLMPPEEIATTTYYEYLKASLKKANVFKSAWENIQRFQKAEVIYNQINTLSYILYLACNIASLLGGLWYFIVVIFYLRKIGQHKVQEKKT